MHVVNLCAIINLQTSQKEVIMAYVGKFNHQLDQKNRLRIPAKLKAELGQNFAIVRGTSGCLFIYSEEQFANLYEEKSKNISFVTEEGKEATDALRRMVATMSIPEEDNQGRFVLDANLRRIAKIQKDVVFVGMFDRIELWSAETYNERFKDLDDEEYDQSLEPLGKFGF